MDRGVNVESCLEHFCQFNGRAVTRGLMLILTQNIQIQHSFIQFNIRDLIDRSTPQAKFVCFSGQSLGLCSHNVTTMSGDELDMMDLQQLSCVIGRVSIFHRTTPRHKLKIIKVSSMLQPSCCDIALFCQCRFVVCLLAQFSGLA